MRVPCQDPVSCIICVCLAAGQSQEKLGGAAACAVKRTNLDKRIAWKARDTGANLKEAFEVGTTNPTFSEERGLWTVESTEVRHPGLQKVASMPLLC